MSSIRNEILNSIALQNGLGHRYAGLTMDNFLIKHQYQEKIKKILEWIIGNYDKKECKDNFFFLGSKGTGKTFAASLLVQELYLNKKINNFSYITLHSYMSKIKYLFASERRDGEGFNIDNYMYADFLILDEFGSYPLTQYDYQLLFDLIDERYNNNLKTCFISNFSKTIEISNFMKSAIFDRVFESVELIEFGNISLRTSNVI